MNFILALILLYYGYTSEDPFKSAILCGCGFFILFIGFYRAKLNARLNNKEIVAPIIISKCPLHTWKYGEDGFMKCVDCGKTPTQAIQSP
jgi:hypothetical protein